ncbi:MAG: 2-C-methyl-D-erythritol 4-phosphate cytidylyltransferase [Succinivibrio sp.]
MSLKVDVIIPAAGVGKRMQLNIPKQYAVVNGKTVLEHTVSALLSSPFVGQIIIGTSASDEYFSELSLASKQGIIRAEGGAERCDTVRKCLPFVKSDYVMVHDAARPLVSSEDIEKLCVQGCMEDCDGAILCSAVADTIKKGSDNFISATVDRKSLFRAFTPQLFRTADLSKALDYAHKNNLIVTDDASAIELLGLKVKLVEGRADNFKLTTPYDMELFKFIISRKDHV